MKCIPILIVAALLGIAGAGIAAESPCPSRGPCFVAPPPPPPPAPPPPPPLAELPPLPDIPAPPPLPVVPDSAHKACSGKAVGAVFSFSPGKGETMSGTCEMDSKGMYFSLQSYRSAN